MGGNRHVRERVHVVREGVHDGGTCRHPTPDKDTRDFRFSRIGPRGPPLPDDVSPRSPPR